MNLLQLASPNKRLSRGGFWFLALAVWLVFYLLSNAAGANAGVFLTRALNGLVVTSLALLCIRRLHDRGYSGWYLLVIFIPVMGALWLLWQCAFRHGLPHSNRWGEDPTQPGGDYLVVG